MPVVVDEKRTCTSASALLRGRDEERPELLQRPIAVNGDRAVLARPVERAAEVL